MINSAVAALPGALAGYAAYLLSVKAVKAAASKRGLAEYACRHPAAAGAVSALLGAAAAIAAGSAADLAYLLILLFLLLSASLTDLEYRIIPNGITASVFLLKAAYGIPALFSVPGFEGFDIVSSLSGLAALFVLFAIPSFTGKGMGFGDVKLASALGFALGLRGGLLCVALMGFAVLAYTAASFLAMRLPEASGFLSSVKKKIPLAPALSFSGMCVLLVQYAIPAVS